MSNYNKSTNFAVKDTLTSGDPDKVVSGAEIDNEFNNIASAVTSKTDKVAAATTDNLAALDTNGNLKDSGGSIVSVAPPVGSVIMHAASTAPSGWLECDGSNVNRATFPDLFNAIGSTFGSGDGSTTFGLPDLRGEFVRGWDNGRGVDSGRNFGTNQSEEVGPHTHFTFFDNNNNQNPNGVPLTNSNYPARNSVSGGTSGAEIAGISGEANVGLTSDRDGTETRPRNIALMYIIKT